MGVARCLNPLRKMVPDSACESHRTMRLLMRTILPMKVKHLKPLHFSAGKALKFTLLLFGCKTFFFEIEPQQEFDQEWVGADRFNKVGKSYAIGGAGSGKDARCGQGLPGFLQTHGFRQHGVGGRLRIPVSEIVQRGCFLPRTNCIGNKMMQRREQLL